MFLGPMDGYPDFRDSGIEGMERFLQKVYRLFELPITNKQISNNNLDFKLHKTIKGVTEDIEQFKYNTAIAKIMELVNTFTEYKVQSTEYLEKLALLLAPFAPHMMEEVWVEYLHKPFSIHKAQWPSYDATKIVQNQATIIVQINGKVRGQLTINNLQGTNKVEVEEMAKKDEKVAKWLDGQEIKKVIFIPGKLINFVV
jgi:leucyl-tRNA synthetase